MTVIIYKCLYKSVNTGCICEEQHKKNKDKEGNQFRVTSNVLRNINNALRLRYVLNEPYEFIIRS